MSSFCILIFILGDKVEGFHLCHALINYTISY